MRGIFAVPDKGHLVKINAEFEYLCLSSPNDQLTVVCIFHSILLNFCKLLLTDSFVTFFFLVVHIVVQGLETRRRMYACSCVASCLFCNVKKGCLQ